MDTPEKQIKESLQMLKFQFDANKKYHALKKELLTNGVDYENELFKVIDEIVVDKEKTQFIKEIPAGTILYRAREIKIDDYSKPEMGLKVKLENGKFVTEGFNEKNSIECPIGIGNDGRNNVAGMSYLYVAQDVATACAEIKSTLRNLISVAEFEVKTPLKIIDFSNDDKKFTYELNEEYQMSIGKFITLLMFQYCQPAVDVMDYKMTQILSDYIRKMGFDGIMYRSFFTMNNNYTIFNCHKSKIAFMSSRIVSHQFVDDVFWDYNHEESIHTNMDEETEYDTEIANDTLRWMNGTFAKK